MKSPNELLAEESPDGDPRPAGWRRARRPEHKHERRQAILGAALTLLDEHGVDGATLSAIAREAGLSKANCYRYFESREAILLAVMLDEAGGWTHEVASRLAPLAGAGDVDAVVEVLVGTTVARPRISMLVSSLWSVLERNVGVESIAEFKRRFHDVIFGSVDAVAAALPSISSDDARAFITFFFLFAAGAWPASNPSPAVAEVLEREEFAAMSIDFEAVLRAHAHTVLRGLAAGHG